MSPHTKAQLQIHFCVLLWGFTAIVGKLITLAALPLVWWRMLIAAGALAVLPRVWHACRRMSPRLVAGYAFVGVALALHWLTFYASVKLANASVAATCMGLAPAFLALIEPVIMRRPFDLRELALGIAVIPGVALVAGGLPDAMFEGLVVGIVSAFFVAIYGVVNKRLVDASDPLAITALELATGVVVLGLAMPFVASTGEAFAVPGAADAFWLTVLALVLTVLPLTLSLVAMRHISAFGVQLATNLEPVYVVLIAMVLFGEHHELTWQFYAGLAVILGAVLAYPLIKRAE
ncbi:DMT family transporter [Tahibacter soli]|jgi:drug/metabolite transporter (DMT)-like permease|uniref:DMT family transporter n=1 Tax=Tahibacter soli TaxID=2983605 RepID=A0A9X3YHH5_9GAMM|nr:DMT family transporter [Tahibacter soli]MDC8012367.1 DMT family transporter [Tahibacter soli]